MDTFNQNLKIVVSGFSGNEGKSTICRHLLAPRIPNAELIAIETINNGGVGKKVRPEHFVKIIEQVILAESAIIDVGSSNVEEFILKMSQQEGVHEDIDYFILPVTCDEKQQIDFSQAIDCFKALEVPSEKIIVLFNKVKETDAIDDVFSVAIEAAINAGIPINMNAKIAFNEFYQQLKLAGLSVDDIKSDKTDYRVKISGLTNIEARNKCVHMISLHRLYKKSAANLDIVFNELFGQKAV